uniref:DNA-directed RNA polymerase subunit beta n=1 Tax=Nephroselmis pyriformis TaxID=156128 RepID=A0A8A2H8C2_9CHLO|nr:RNA polymerase beta subunit [Nephroselmis pyriformis]QSV37304.1 RNA polymerase beta subunit [Nephroselmis pyriformis]
MIRLYPQAAPFRLPDLVALQRESFLHFLIEGLAEQLHEFNPITSPNGDLELRLSPERYQFKRPRYPVQEASWRAMTYSGALYVPAQLTNLRTGQIQSEYVFLGDFPLMTDRGHFIIHGSARVIVNQIIRSPGLYYKEVSDHKGRRTHVASLISNRGAWIRIETDRYGMIWARMDKVKKISMFVVLQALGFSPSEILQSLRHPEFVMKAFSVLLEKQVWQKRSEELMAHSTHQALLQVLGKLYPDKPPSVRSARKLLFLRFMDPRRYDLGAIGRLQLNKKLHLTGGWDIHTLRPVDLLAATDYLINLECRTGQVDDIDHLKNRRVRSAGELIQNQVRIGMTRLERIVLDRFKEPSQGRLRLHSLMNPKPMSGALREFFGSSQLSQFMDQTNPLSEITHKRRLSSLGPGGISRDRAGMAVREIHPSHYGRICPIETPEGPNAGLIGSMATYARVNPQGFLESPFYRVQEGEVQWEAGPTYLSAAQEDELRVSPGDLLVGDSLPDRPLPIRYQKEFLTTTRSHVEYIGVSPTQMISVATSLIPFLEHDDANRALMGSNMQRQAVPILQPERPWVGTGLEGQVALDSGTVICADRNGYVDYVDARKIVVVDPESSSSSTQYLLQSYYRSNQDTCMHQRPVVQAGEWVERGDLLADGAASVGGELALGKNICVAYMPWEGYNFEDAILISERLVYEDLYTSLHIERHEIETRQTKLGAEEITRDVPSVGAYPLRHLDDRGIVYPGAQVEPGDILVGKVSPKEDMDVPPEGRLLQAIFGHKARDVRDTSLRVPTGVHGRVLDVRILKGVPGAPPDPQGTATNECVIHVYLVHKRRLQVGDKMAGRHGNKGIVSRILPRQDMPYCQDGTPVDMVLNPLGVPSRMNVGQVFECLLGLAGMHLQEQFKVRAFDEMYEEQASRGFVYSKLYEARQKTGYRWLFDPAHPGKSRLFDGRTGEPFDQPVTVGQAYMLKLVHLVDEKIHARSTGPYSLVTQQPLGGRSKHGGQRLGEMEVWALEGFGAAYTLQELLTVKSDDMQGRNEAMNAIIKGEAIPSPGTPESFKVLIRELQCLCLDIGVYEIDPEAYDDGHEIDIYHIF